MIGGPDLDLSFSFTLEVDQNNCIIEKPTRFQSIMVSLTASLQQAKADGKSVCKAIVKCATIGMWKGE